MRQEQKVMGDKIKILVVDDESRMRKLVRDFLEREGYQVLEAGDGLEAMELFYEEKDIALLILDVMMPKMDGWQVCREIRQSSKVPIIMLTARSEERDELQGFQLGVDEYISKPFSPKILVARVGAILRRSRVVSEEEVTDACSRSFYVGEDITEEDIKAEFKHGLLKLFVPKKEAKPAVEQKKTISIEG